MKHYYAYEQINHKLGTKNANTGRLYMASLLRFYTAENRNWWVSDDCNNRAMIGAKQARAEFPAMAKTGPNAYGEIVAQWVEDEPAGAERLFN